MVFCMQELAEVLGSCDCSTVLDDNKKLCLVSGEIIQLSSSMLMMFEVEDLAVASPATVSRCGMVYMEPTSLGTGPLLQSWLDNFVDGPLNNYIGLLRELFERVTLPMVNFVYSGTIRETVPTVCHNLVASYFRVMDALINAMTAQWLDPQQLCSVLNRSMASLVLFSTVWSVGASCDKGSRQFFDVHFRACVHKTGNGDFIKAMCPEAGTVYDWAFHLGEVRWIDWMSTHPGYTCNPEQQFQDIMVPTADSTCYTFILRTLILKGSHILAVGETGTGKTMTIQAMLNTAIPAEFEYLPLTFSARTSANQTQDVIDGKLDKRRKGVYGPPTGRQLIVYIDDLNMPEREKYFAQPPVELLRQWMDHNGWYERKPPCAFKNLIDTQFIASMGPPGGGRNPMTARMMRHFNIISFGVMSDQSVIHIFDTILGAFVSTAFSEPFRTAVPDLIKATVAVYNTLQAKLLPTPAKSHYLFNTRDVARVVQGLTRGDCTTIAKIDQVLSLWLHEMLRVFGDRLVCDEDHVQLHARLQEVLQQTFNYGYKDIAPAGRLVFGDFLVPSADPKVYTHIKDVLRLQRVMEEYLEDYNSSNASPMNLVMFLDAAEHVCRICRLIRTPLGHALLLGMGGSGRQSLTKLACYIEDFELFQIEISKQFGPSEWQDALRQVLKHAGIDGRESVFLFTDTQVAWEGMLEDVNNILDSGQVPNLLKAEDIEEIAAAMRPLLAADGIAPTKAALHSRFVTRVRSRLHLVLAMTPLGEAYRKRLRMFPALVNCCTIDWFREWPVDALKSVANSFYSDLEFDDDTTSSVRDGVVLASVYLHQSVERLSHRYAAELGRINYVTPTSYLELLTTFKRLLEEKRVEIVTSRVRLETGLQKLLSTADQVTVMQTDLHGLQPVLTRTAEDVEEMMKKIDLDKQAAAETKAVVAAQEEAANQKAASAKAIADDAQADLDKALPALEEAVSSLKSLSKNDVVEVKSMSNPPAGVKLVMDATCIMFDMKGKKVPDPNGLPNAPKITDYWDDAKKILSDASRFLNSLMTFDKDNIPSALIKKVAPYIEMEEFHPDNVAKVSKACKSICQWVRAMFVYHNVALQVEPKRAALAKAQSELDETKQQLAKAQLHLKEVEDSIAFLEAQFNDALAKKDSLGKQVEDCQAKLQRADKLIGGLGGEKTRWQQTVKDLQAAMTNVVGDVIIAAGSIAYAGPFTPSFRGDLRQQWTAFLRGRHIPCSRGSSLTQTLADPVQARAWALSGLPRDSVSLENGMIVSKARRWPLMIDPQGQANKWIRCMEKDNKLSVVKLSDKDMLRTLEGGIRFGRPVLLENIGEKLDASLEPVLLKQTFKTASNCESIKIGDKVITYHPDFRFYLTTKLRNPHYAPEIAVKVSLLNFFVTPEGLEEQLLAAVVNKERPDLANMKNQLVLGNARMKKELKEIEDEILHMLSSSQRSTLQGNILDDVELINTLSKSKVTSNQIAAKVSEAEATEQQIDDTRELYRPVAERASLLYFCISDLATVDPMYQYSLSWFQALFLRAMQDAEQSDDITRRGTILNNYFTNSVFVNVSRSLFERHKLLFSLLLAVQILLATHAVDPREWRYLLAGPPNTDYSDSVPAIWMTQKSWVELQNLSALPAFHGFAEHVSSNITHYQKLFDSSDTHLLPLAEPFQSKLSSFQRLLVLRCLRPDKVVPAIQLFVMEHLGSQFVEAPPLDLNACFEESGPVTPLIFILSAGADPMADLLKLADGMQFSSKFEKISLGQGQGPKAQKLLQQGMEAGLWVCLQNCHLAASWMPMLEQILESADVNSMHRDFRLWLTAMPSLDFPVSILQNGVKMTLEPRKGLRSNVARQLAKLDNDFVMKSAKPDAWQKLLFGMCLFHAVVLDRRKFGPLGWNTRYDFTDGDLSVSLAQMREYLDTYESIPFKVLQFLFTEINYGGRVTDIKDRRLMNHLLFNFCNQNVTSAGYAFSPSGIYKSSALSDLQGLQKAIEEYPPVPHPEIFGLHENANITCDQNETYEMFATLLSLQPRHSTGLHGISREDLIAQQCTSVLEKLPTLFDLQAVQLSYPIKYEESMNTVLTQECIRYNALLEVMSKTLGQCLQALKGLVVMSPELDAMCTSIFDNEVPAAWEIKAYPSLKPLSSWVTDLLERLKFIFKWVKDGTPNVFWLPGLFFPQAFLTGTLQNFARKHTLPIDSVSFAYVIQDDLADTCTDAPEDGSYISGLFLEGARWDDKQHLLAESMPKELFTGFPVIWLKPEQHHQQHSAGTYECPVYKTLTRAGALSTTGHSTNFIMDIEIPSLHEPRHWVIRGVALMCALAF